MAGAALSAAVPRTRAVILASEAYSSPVHFASTRACSAAWECMASSGACGRLCDTIHIFIRDTLVY